ncbi:MAG: glycosyltransferase [Mycobacteriales bacterium]
MRILQVNKFGTRTSGADNYFLDVGARLAAGGSEVGYLCMRPAAVPADAPLFEVPDVEFHGDKSARDQLAAARRVLWSREGLVAMRAALRTFRPDVVHLHNYAHQLSSSVVAAAYEAGVATVATAHDYKLICPAYTAMRDREPCFRCAPGNPSHCVGGRCLHDSLTWSTVAAAEAAFVRRGRDTRVPGTVLAPSQYMADRLSGSWLQGAGVRVHVLRNPIEAVSVAAPVGRREGAGIYVGRLAAEKGLDILVRAAAAARVEIVIVGDGPERDSLERLARELDAPVRFPGFLTGAALEAEWSKAGFFAMTSTWPENAPLALLEALVRGLPALLADIGGLPELVGRYGGGRLVPPGDVGAAAAQLPSLAAGDVAAADVVALTNALSWDAHLVTLLSRFEEAAGAH